MTALAYRVLRHEIIFARYAPGEKLNIRAICERHKVGLSAAREALGRLASEGLVTYSEQRGFAIAPLRDETLDELTRTRCWLNEIGLRESIAHGDHLWEEHVVLSYHRMTRLPRYVSDDPDADCNPAWEDSHRAFHTSLVSACRSQWLIAYTEQLFDAADYYRHLSRVSRARRRIRTDEHETIMKAAVERSADRAVELLNAHFRKTADMVRARLAAAGA